MFTPPKTILFATNLTESCLPALLYSTSLADKYGAKLILFHVLEPMSTSLEDRLKWMLGDRYKWMFGKSDYQDILDRRKNDARQRLIGKKSNSSIIRSTLDEFGSHSGIDQQSTGWNTQHIEIDVVKGDVVEEIVKKANSEPCDLIIIGARSGFLVDTNIGNTTKSVISLAKRPVLVVPPIVE